MSKPFFLRLRLLILPFALIANPALAASFDCAAAATTLEKRICTNPDLSELDELLGRFYRGALHVLDHPQCLKQDQRDWLKSVRNACGDDACLNQAYRSRLAYLLELQPGLAVPDRLQLPESPALLWIIPPAQDQEALPELASQRQQVDGQLLYQPERGGFELTSPDDRSITLIPDMLIDPKTAARLQLLQKQETVVRASGWLARTDEGWMFDNRHCVTLTEAAQP